MENISISVVMPALNEEASIADAINDTLNSFKKFSLDGEVIVINDGSSDKTKEIVESLIKANPDRVRLINHSNPMGMGRSFWDGVENSAKEAVTLLPGDHENDADEILQHAHKIHQADMVVPFVTNREVRSFSRNFLSKTFTFIINLTFGTRFKYTNGTIIYRRWILEEIACRASGFFFQAETLIKAAKKGHSFVQVPYKLSQRSAGVSKAVSFRSLVKVMKNYLGLIKDVYFK